MINSPTALQLKELETRGEVTEKFDKIPVFGDLGAAREDLTKIQ